VVVEFLDPVDNAFERKMQSAGFSQAWYSESKIKLCTDNFAHKIGQGGFGDVFYGKLPDGQEIAAKVLTADSWQSKQEFYNEVREQDCSTAQAGTTVSTTTTGSLKSVVVARHRSTNYNAKSPCTIHRKGEVPFILN